MLAPKFVPPPRVTDLYADNNCLKAASTAQLQARIDALAACCQILHMQISVAKTNDEFLLMLASSHLYMQQTAYCRGVRKEKSL